MSARRFFVGGNFKMNGTVNSTKELFQNLNKASLDPDVEIVVAPSGLHLMLARDVLRANIGIAAQNLSDKNAGAFTGEICGSQLVDAKINWVIIGHSERRTLHGETSALVADKVKAALVSGLKVIVCCGESLEEREAGKTVQVVTKQLNAVANTLKTIEQSTNSDSKTGWSSIVIAYEPIWAIGTGKVATVQQANEVHVAIRKWIASTVSEFVASQTRIIYGGSVNGKNCHELARQLDIDGFLVGGASLKPEFLDIINSNRRPESL